MRSLEHGFHDGERAVQHAADVRAEAGRLEGMLGPADLSPGVRRFLSGQTLVAMTARDHTGRLWVTMLVGPPGFVEATGPTTLHIDAVPSAAGDPLRDLRPDQPVGTIALDLARRRRFRLNGQLTHVSDHSLDIEVGEAFGNCPQYIAPRSLNLIGHDADPHPAAGHESSALDEDDRALVARADTFVLGTTHPSRGNDASHRGGPPGFVRVEDTLWWPDYAGNNMFTSLGNLAIDPEAALLFVDFDDGRALHLSGRARLAHVGRGTDGDEGGTGRRVLFDPTAVSRASVAVRSTSSGPVPSATTRGT